MNKNTKNKYIEMILKKTKKVRYGMRRRKCDLLLFFLLPFIEQLKQEVQILPQQLRPNTVSPNAKRLLSCSIIFLKKKSRKTNHWWKSLKDSITSYSSGFWKERRGVGEKREKGEKDKGREEKEKWRKGRKKWMGNILMAC